MNKLAHFTTRRHWWVLAAWIALIAIVSLISAGIGGADYRDSFTLPHTETAKVTALLKESGQSGQSGISGTMVLKSDTALTAAPANVIPGLQKLCGSGLQINGATTPWGSISCSAPATVKPLNVTGANPLLSEDQKLGLVTINWEEGQFSQNLFTDAYDDLKTLKTDQVQVEFTGDAFQGIGQEQKGIPPVLLGFVAALIVLALFFRSLLATILPLISAIAALLTGLGLIGILTHVMDVSNVTPQLTELMVIGVGVDYALFLVTRHRRNLLAGMSMSDSIALAVNTSGRAVVFAGGTVCIAMLGLAVLGVSFFYGVAIGTAIGVSLTVLASLTLTPALLSFFGLRILPRSQRKAVREGTYVAPERVAFWKRWAVIVEHRKVFLGAGALAIIVALSIPFFSIRLGHADQGNDPKGSTTRTGYDLISAPKPAGFGTGYNSTLELVVAGPGAADAGFMGEVTDALKGTPDVDGASLRSIPLTKTLTLVSFKSTTAPQDAATTNLVKGLRSRELPPVYKNTENKVYVYGQTAIYVDFAKVLSSKLPLFFVLIIGLSFILLLIAFRSLLIPATAAVMNVFAAGASFGLIVMIFQWGWGAEALGIGSGGPIEAFAPALFFAILFGLSMDYQVFLVSRMHEEWVHTKDNSRAVTVGQGETGGIITAAAIIMISVFGGFILGDNRVVKLIGIGLASAVFIDAFVLRTVLVPALMHAFGKANWFFPKWLDRITPQVAIEAADNELPPEPEQELVSAGSR
jgi:RND superfamily putative drug exporter